MLELVFLLAALVCIVMVASSTFVNDKMIYADQLPIMAKAFVHQNFPGHSIAYATIDRSFANNMYEVCLNNGVELGFDDQGNWDRVDCNLDAVPIQLIPDCVDDYVKSNFTDVVVNRIHKKYYGYKVELSNHLNLKLNDEGELTSKGS